MDIYTLDSTHVVTAMAADMIPALRVPDGAVICAQTQDCYMNNLRAENDPRGAAPGPAVGCNPATGPIYVEGAMPGDTLRVDILNIEVGPWASMRISNRGGLMRDRVTSPIVRCIALDGDKAALGGVEVPLEPMIGVIGVAPETGEIDTETPFNHGGNMDTRLITAGSTVYLPVRREGALLALGDVHAAMGDGEVCICGLECPAHVTLRVTVIPDIQEPWPMVRDAEGGLSVVASAKSLDEAAKIAADSMLDYLKRRTDVDENELILLMSLLSHLEISQVVDPLVTARCRLRDWDVPFDPKERA